MIDEQENVSSAVGQTVVDNPVTLDTLAQAAYVLKCYSKGLTKEQLIECLKNEASLAQAYFIFFKQMGWIKGETANESIMGKWFLTEKGKKTLAQFEGSPTEIRHAAS